MKKSSYLLSVEKRLRSNIEKITPEVYAGIALALHRKYGWGYKRINDLFTESQSIWMECNEKGIKMVEMCEEETGISVVRKVSEKC